MEHLSFRALYSKDIGKKRKIFHDGVVEIKNGIGNMCTVILKDEDGKEIKRSKETDFSRFSAGSELVISGGFEVHLEEIINLNQPLACIEPKSSIPISSCTQSFNHMKKKKFILKSKPIGSAVRDLATKSISKYNDPELDPLFDRVMKPHQKEGAIFILKCLKITRHNDIENSNIQRGYENDDINLMKIKSYSHQNDLEKPDVSGVILADEMGLGKTLTTISVIWAYVKSNSSKSIVVCPTSLVDNWNNEFKKWLGTRINPLVIKASGIDPNSVINTFSISNIKKYPVLIISYEMFRKYSQSLNNVPDLNLIVCDEGHRLKNIDGTKTINSLCQFRANKRIVLTGTPIQNDLEELFSIVSFAIPGYLGSFQEFKSQFIIPITHRDDKDFYSPESIEQIQEELSNKLSRIILRRTQSDILTTLLPPKVESIVLIKLNSAQKSVYDQSVQDIMSSVGIQDIHEKAEGDTDDLSLDMSEEALEDSIQSNQSASIILPGLQRLRKICCISDTGRPNNFQTSLDRKSSNSLLNQPYQASKLQFLSVFLDSLASQRPIENIVIVSNFTSHLNSIEAMLKLKNISSLFRLDGQTPIDERQRMVNRFNRFETPNLCSDQISVNDEVNEDQSGGFAVFLLSAKAGGCGINLIGASRLIMYDIDWNPAIDAQAMSRIYRQGQKKPVFIYRFIASNTIEESILQRQEIKSCLTQLIKSSSQSNSSSNKSKKFVLTKNDLSQLFYPNKETLCQSDKSLASDLDIQLIEQKDKLLAHILKTKGSINSVQNVLFPGDSSQKEEESTSD